MASRHVCPFTYGPSFELKLNVRSAEELQNAPDLKAFAAWADNHTQEDFLWAPERVQTTQSEIAEYAGAVG